MCVCVCFACVCVCVYVHMSSWGATKAQSNQCCVYTHPQLQCSLTLTLTLQHGIYPLPLRIASKTQMHAIPQTASLINTPHRQWYIRELSMEKEKIFHWERALLCSLGDGFRSNSRTFHTPSGGVTQFMPLCSSTQAM